MTQRVLIVEDDRVVAMDLRDALTEQGFIVVGSTGRGEDATRLAAAGRADVVLMDIRLEGAIDGIEAAARVTSELDLPVVFLTAQSDAETVRRIHEQGSEGYLIKPFNDQQLPHVLDAAIDRHRQARAERERSNQLWVVLHSMAEAVLSVDPDCRVQHLNPAAADLLGVGDAPVRGRPVNEVLRLTDGQGGPALADPCGQALAVGQRTALPAGAWVQPAAGLARPVSGTVSPTRDDNGEVVGAVLVLQDQTESRRVLDLIEHADRQESMSVLGASIAHEINNPLTYILANASTATTMAESLGAAELRDLLADVVTGAERIERIVRDLKLLAAPASGELPEIDPRGVVERSVRTIAPLIRQRGRLETALPPVPYVRASPVSLGQVVVNIVKNAAQALPTGGYRADRVVRVELRSGGGWVVLDVSDNGSGMAADVLRRAQEPFFTTRPAGEGSGLGLSVASRIVGHLGGAIEVRSKPGEGTSVRVRLPATGARVPAPDAPAAGGEATPEDAGQRVLLVDDDPLVRRAIAAMLRRRGEVQVAASVDEAWALLEVDSAFDVLLVDLWMAPHDGLTLYERLLATRPELASRVAFITGGAVALDTRERALRSGRPIGYKPFSGEELEALLVEAVARG